MADQKSYFQGQEQAVAYKAYRRPMPEDLVKKIIKFLSQTFEPSECDAADVGCGSGQATLALAPFLNGIVGIEVSQAQLDQIDMNSLPINVHFHIGESENLPFDDSSLQLVNTKSALHWFDIPKFFKEVERVLKPGGVLAVSAGGGHCDVVGHEEATKEIMNKIMPSKKVGPDHDARIKLVQNRYWDISFPFDEVIRDLTYVDEYMGTVDDYVNSWTAKTGFDRFRKEHPDEAKKILSEAKEKLMKLLGFDGRPEEASVKLSSPYTLILCRKGK